ncbi:gp59 putative baseplate protein [Iodobacter phage PhiPLPE]|uniref:Gp59 putative baseplate protein n=1 Tax=Iodobacter phage PhiPLPE TaxID=551895 RepID=B5AX78_9CAUD|nr:baseplate spike [Iodobacter phage PhiPLPE]ACG60381.1 gp59 putative baseplate protein [Iodobacter phage PhiPLPE]
MTPQKVTQTDLMKTAFVEMMKDVCTSIPGHILAFTAGGQIAQVQIGIMRVDVNGQTFAPPPLIEVPVYFAGGSKFMIEHQLDPGDEGIVLFSQRCIDGWFNTGGVGENPIGRFHDYADAMFLPGMRSQPNAIKSFANNGIRMRDASGSSYIWLKNDGTGEIKVSTLKIIGDVEHTGSQKTSGTIEAPNVKATTKAESPIMSATTSLTVAGKEMGNHTHGGVQTGPNNTGVPN